MRLIHGLILLLSVTLANAAVPIFAIIPTTATTASLPANGSVTVQYRVTNQTQITRTLTLQPIQGVSQVTGGTGACTSPFTLPHNHSCLLTLTISGRQMASSISGGPVVCKTKNPTDNSPDRFLCAQPNAENQLQITRIDAETVNISLTPTTLSLIVGESNEPLTVTNHSHFVTATNILAAIPGALNVTQNTSACAALAPGASCQILLTPSTATTAAIPITVKGTNTTQATFRLKIAEARLLITPSSLSFLINHPETVTITNQSATIGANNVNATLPIGSPLVISNNTCSTLLLPGNSCTITFNSTLPTDPASFDIEGTNTSVEPTPITANAFLYIIDVNNNAWSCPIGGNFIPGACTNLGNTGGTFNNVTSITINPEGNYAYANNRGSNTLSGCPIDTTTGAFGPCISLAPVFTQSMGVTVDPNDAFAYVTTFNNEVFSCTINSDHSLTSPCNSLGNPGGTFNVPAGIIVNSANTIAYITNSNSGTLSQCPLAGGIFSGNCTSTTAVGGNDTFPLTIVLDEFINQVYTGINNHLYLAVCPILAGGNLGACSELRNGAFNTSPTGVAILNNNAGIAYVYALLGNEPVVACAVKNDGTFSSCTGSTTSITFPSSAMAVTR